MNCKKIFGVLRPILFFSIFFLVILGLLYPLLLGGLSRLFFPKQAEGSLVKVGNRVVGSLYTGQEWTKPYLLHGRPSSIHYNTYIEKNGEKIYRDGQAFPGVKSGSENLGPSSLALKKRVEEAIQSFRKENPDIPLSEIPFSLLSESGSALDPDITVKGAEVQIPRIVSASGLTEETVRSIIRKHTDAPLFGLYGEKKVSVLLVNLDLLKAMKCLPK